MNDFNNTNLNVHNSFFNVLIILFKIKGILIIFEKYFLNFNRNVVLANILYAFN